MALGEASGTPAWVQRLSAGTAVARLPASTYPIIRRADLSSFNSSTRRFGPETDSESKSMGIEPPR